METKLYAREETEMKVGIGDGAGGLERWLRRERVRIEIAVVFFAGRCRSQLVPIVTGRLSKRLGCRRNIHPSGPVHPNPHMGAPTFFPRCSLRKRKQAIPTDRKTFSSPGRATARNPGTNPPYSVPLCRSCPVETASTEMTANENAGKLPCQTGAS